ncbi:coproporphyrinogen-III oxidase 1, chloroplastic-like isoform X1 [Camellia sinensis]|uniref:coproporphyrinogen oxidase n=1 Tax=Camellia sinensis var. sinensis TaxID=542762 RepID=A0A4S4DJ94_CAMSN|nr:coproporphyrinogen-III oxidase 1, chloroplastic-like isoform X1 [Camellia sinensis]QUV72272.1 CPOX1 [Camellia sinensis]THG02920.1 hypothetical protein TEA_013820 [Camellia sinensis var. sinensis]
MLTTILSSTTTTTTTFPVTYSFTQLPSSSYSSSSSSNSTSSSLTLTRTRTRNPILLRVRASSSMIEKERPESQRPLTFLRESDDELSSISDSNSTPSSSVRARFEKMIREAQDSVCLAIEAVDGGGKFKEDVWSRPGGGGGISRVLQDGDIWEKAGVNVSVVYGVMPPEAYRAAKPANSSDVKPGPVPFFAAGISSVLHPKNPFAPTLHFNYRYFETDAPSDAPGAPRQWWFGGGTDLTPAYIFEEDVKHFHSVQKSSCDKFDPSFYPRFKKWCDDYFYIKHRGERRGLGGIFFDDLNDYDQEMLLSFATECANSVVPAYIPIIERRKDTPFTDQHKAWQQLRRGRYVEFNLVYDRGTTFGLKTGGRIESILVSLPLSARWEYDHKPEEGSEEWKLLDACINPKEWV